MSLYHDLLSHLVIQMKILTLLSQKTILTEVEYILQIYWEYTSKEYLKYTFSILEAYFKYTLSILEVYLKYTSSILQPIKLKKRKYTSNLCYFDKRSTFEAHFVKSNQHFNVNLKYISSIRHVHFK